MQQTSNADGPVPAGQASGEGAIDTSGVVAAALAGFLEIRGTSDGTWLAPLGPRFENHDERSPAATITISADGMTVGVERGPAIRLTGIVAIEGVDDLGS